MKFEVVKASEIAEFCYCPRAWWLSYHRVRYQTELMKQGIVRHDKLAWNTRLFHHLKLVGYILVSVGITGIIAFLFLRFLF